MKIGAKIFGIKNKPFLDKIAEKVDFIEIMAIQGQDYSFLKSYGKKIALHAEHQEFGINPADASKNNENTKSINFAFELAGRLDAGKIICHAGAIENENCSEETAIEFFRNIKNNRILIENLPLIDYNGRRIDALCSMPEQTETFLERCNKRLCFDIPHSIISTIAKGKKDYNDFIKPYLKLKPSYFHFSDILLEKAKDHLNLGKGNLNIEFYKKLIPKDAEVALETNSNNIAENFLNDIRIMRE